MSRVLITGGAGFLGRNLAVHLADAGHEVTTFDLNDLDVPGVASLRGDLGSWAEVFDAVRLVQPERIYHCGALLSSLAEANVLRAIRTNADGTFHVLEAARQLDVAKVIFTSTTATYGEGVDDPVPEGAPQRPTTIYGVTKVYGERLGEYYARRFGIDFRGLRLPSVIGPGRGATGVSAYTSLMIDEPARGRSYAVPVSERTAMPILYVEDAVRALTELSEASPPTRLVYNIAGLSPTTGEIASELCHLLPAASLTFRPDPAVQAVVDSWPVAMDDGPARQEWGWRLGFDLPTLLEHFIEAVRADASVEELQEVAR